MTPDDHNQIWDHVEAGQSYTSVAKMMGSGLTTIRDYVAKHDGLRPLPPKPRSEKRLSVAEREEISRGLDLDESFRAIARCIKRAPPTVSREVNNNGGRTRYRAVVAEATSGREFLTSNNFPVITLQPWMTADVGEALGLPPHDWTVATIEPRPA